MGKIPDTQLETIKKLYYKKNFGMNDIAKELKVSIDAVCYFMRRNNLKRRSLVEINKIAFAKKPLSFYLKERLSADDLELKTIGTLIYWCEGYKTIKSRGIDFANCDPEMVVTFVKFLRQICGIDENRLRVLLYCYSNQKPNRLINYWSKFTKIPKKQFSKPYVRTDFKIAKEGKMPYGLVHIRYSDKKLLALLMEWISDIKRKYAPVV